MQIQILFTPNEACEAIQKTQSIGNVFTFIFNIESNENVTYEINPFIAYILSKKVQNLISFDPTTTQFCITEMHSKTFLDFFFNSIRNSFILQIDENSIQEFFKLVEELKIESMSRSIKTAVHSFLLQKLTNQDFSNEETKLNYLYENFTRIDMETVEKMPENIIDEIISNAKFTNDDEYARYMMKSKNFFEKYYQNIKYDNLSNSVIGEVISSIQFEDLNGSDQYVLHSIFNRCQKEISKKIIKILNIRSLASIDFSFIEHLNDEVENKEYFIHYATLYDTNVEEKLRSDKKFLALFDIVVIGGSDSFGYNTNCLTPNLINDLKAYHNKDGIILFLHDVTYIKSKEVVRPFSNLMGFSDNNVPNERFKQVDFIEASGKDDVITKPFFVGRNFPVSETHCTPVYNSQYVVVTFGQNNHNYYSENLEEHFADIQMGHTIGITNEEQKFFFNVICHLYNFSRNHHIKTKLYY